MGTLQTSSFITKNQNVEPKIVVLIPCLNEEKTIAKVVRDFKNELPQAEIIVFDNNSIDRTEQEARAAGATVESEKRRGKGFVVQSMFQRVEADVFVLVDGDDTYPAEMVHDLISHILKDEADMTVGSRISSGSKSQFHPLNRLGNKFYQYMINTIFRTRLSDILSGYRCMNRRFVKGIPIFVTGFEVETELTIKALERGYRITEIPIDLRSRHEGSASKIRIFRDGFKILWTILALFRDYKPLTFFGIVGMLFILVGFIPGLIVIYEYFTTGLVLRFPSAILAVGLVVTGMLLLVIGLTLHTINRRFQELEYYMRLHAERSGK